jgi:hypothetical protein
VEAEEAEEVQDVEVVDGLPVITETGELEQRPTAVVSAAQATALACTGFVAGAATIAVVSRHRTKRALKKSKRSGPIGEIVSSRSFLVDVHLLRRD